MLGRGLLRACRIRRCREQRRRAGDDPGPSCSQRNVGIDRGVL